MFTIIIRENINKSWDDLLSILRFQFLLFGKFLQPHIRINIPEKCIQDIDLYIARTHLFHTSTEVYSRISVSCRIRTPCNVSPNSYEGTIDILLCSYMHWSHITTFYICNKRINAFLVFCTHSSSLLCR